MRVTLNQDELFEAISNHLISRLNLDPSANIEISLTAGRSPKGYTADVDITYPKSDNGLKITAKAPDEELTGEGTQAAAETTVTSGSVSAAVPKDALFGI